MTDTSFDRPAKGISAQPRPDIDATTAMKLVAHLAATVILAVVVLFAAWQFLFTGAPSENNNTGATWASASRR
ncbi:MAG: hypothetical protein QOD39_4092 [Mycobacterium sp.]|nr:hypothetical protein [Mycobacterium sp.]